MSQIAQALAKAKERTGQTTAPFMTAKSGSTAPFSPDRAAASAAAIKKAKNSQRFWLIVAIITLPLTAFIVWTQLRSLPGSEAAPAAVQQQATAPSTPASSPTTASTPAVPAAKPAAPAPGSVAPRAEIQQVVNNLSISAVMSDPPRIMLAGRIVRAGQPIEGGIVFTGIANGQVQFTDNAGAVYSRHY